MSSASGDIRSRTIVLIPARLRATRLPDKPLLSIVGAPMIVHVLRRAREADIGRVVVASGDAAIAEAVRADGGEAVMTSPALPSGTDRIRAALDAIDPERRYERVVNLQGDLPLIESSALNAVLDPLDAPGTDIGTLTALSDDPAESSNPNVVKAIVAWRGETGRALYFTRAAPYGGGPIDHHIGVYAFTRAALERFADLQPSPLEQKERLEQLRALENGMTIGVKRVAAVPLGIDTAEDLAAARRIMQRG